MRITAGFLSSGTGSNQGIVYHLLRDASVSPSTAQTIDLYTVGPMRILLVVVIALALSRLVKRFSRRLVDGLRLVSPLVRATDRGSDRARTLTVVFGSVFRVIIWIVAFLTILGQLSINLTPFVATATVIGAAVGFGAQTLVKDFLSGVLILAEDQYGVGDSIVIGAGPNATTGTVEGVNLRTTRVRSLDGVVWYVPNGEIRTVGNNTETDSQALVDIVVPHGTDLVTAGATAQEASRAVARDPAWDGVFIGEPVFAGIQAEDDVGATLRIMAWTKPGQHFRAARELRLRVLERLRADGIAWGPPPEPPEPAEPPAPAAPAQGET